MDFIEVLKYKEFTPENFKYISEQGRIFYKDKDTGMHYILDEVVKVLDEIGYDPILESKKYFAKHYS